VKRNRQALIKTVLAPPSTLPSRSSARQSKAALLYFYLKFFAIISLSYIVLIDIIDGNHQANY
jgi:hypothetical protein